MKIEFWLLTLFLYLEQIFCEILSLRGNTEVEFNEHLEEGEHWGVQFQIVEGTIGFKLNTPDGVIFESASETYGSYSITAKSHGEHTFKFWNPPGETRKVTFNVLGGGHSNEEGLDPLHRELQELNDGLKMIKDEQEMLMERGINHCKVAEGTNNRVWIWNIFQVVLLISVVFFQNYSLKRFFEVRRVV